MTTADEAAAAGTPLAAALGQGLDTLDLGQTVEFVKYIRVVLALDGFVFWVRADLLRGGAAFNEAAYNAILFNAVPKQSAAAPVKVVKGSLHVATTQQQNEDESFAVNYMIFTARSQIQDFDVMLPHEMYIGRQGDLQFAFAEQRSFYQQADLFHYRGDAVYPALATQVIDDLAQFSSRNLIVSNSLPIWLGLNKIMPVFPSFLVPDNIRPPYASVHIPPDRTMALQPIPNLGPTSTHYQLASDEVRVTTYGLNNNAALDYQDYIYDFMTNHDEVMGLMNAPIMRDEKRAQNEMSIIAQKKTITFKVSYYQQTARDIARKLILSCIPTFVIS